MTSDLMTFTAFTCLHSPGLEGQLGNIAVMFEFILYFSMYYLENQVIKFCMSL